MKLNKIIFCAAIAGAMTLSASKVSAFPLKLTSASGTLNTTAYYGSDASTTSNKLTKATYNLKKLFQVITNQIHLNSIDSTNSLPAEFDLVYDPYTFTTYLTNKSGYYYNLSGIVSVSIYDVATTFKGNNTGGSESDVVGCELDVYGHGPDGLYYEAEAYGTGRLTASKGSGMAKMSLSLNNGGGYAEYKSSYDGNVSKGQFNFSGSGTAPTNGLPYSVWWYHND